MTNSNYTTLPFNDKYDIIDVMPKWAYDKKQWEELISESDIIIDDTLYKKKEQIVKSDEELLIDDIGL